MINQFLWILAFLLLTVMWLPASAQQPDTLKMSSEVGSDADSLVTEPEVRLRFTQWFYRSIFTGTAKQRNLDVEYKLWEQFNNKTIASLSFQSLEVFGPTFADTAKMPRTGLERFANRIHTTTHARIIRRNLLFRPGDRLTPERILENERILRALPNIQDVMFVITPLENDTGRVAVTVLTKDVFSFGVSFNVDKAQAGGVEIYNHNMWGRGHELSLKAVGHLRKEPYVGVEGFYTARNVNGNFINVRSGYASTYKREGGLLTVDKEFLLESTPWAGKFGFYRFLSSLNIYEYDRIESVAPLNYSIIDFWHGRSVVINKKNRADKLQLVFSGGFRRIKYFERQPAGVDGRTYFASSKLLIGSISLANRLYIRDRLIYSYGIVEDIPRGFLHELAIGFDNNEFRPRGYAHLYLSTGSIIRYRPAYMFLAVGAGGYFHTGGIEQAQLQVELRYISRLFYMGATPARQFVTLDYLGGINRFADEHLYLKNDYGIRGLYSGEITGKQRLVLNLETVVFKKRSIADFKFAFFGFTDLGIVAPEEKMIFKGDYYAGIGMGVRVRNENLVIRTLQLYFAYYPNLPSDANSVTAHFRELGTSRFYSFQPRQPAPLHFE